MERAAGLNHRRAGGSDIINHDQNGVGRHFEDRSAAVERAGDVLAALAGRNLELAGTMAANEEMRDGKAGGTAHAAGDDEGVVDASGQSAPGSHGNGDNDRARAGDVFGGELLHNGFAEELAESIAECAEA